VLERDLYIPRRCPTLKAMEKKEEGAEDTLMALLRQALEQLGRLDEDTLKETVAYLNSEWYHSAIDLKAAMQDAATWDSIKLPSRLKLALKKVLSETRLQQGRPTPLNTSFPTPNSSPSAGATRRGEGEKAETETEAEAEAVKDAQIVWVRCFSPEHKSFYFYNELTEETLWELPVGTPTKDDAWSLDQAEQAACVASGYADYDGTQAGGGEAAAADSGEALGDVWASLALEAEQTRLSLSLQSNVLQLDNHYQRQYQNTAVSSPMLHHSPPEPSAPPLPVPPQGAGGALFSAYELPPAPGSPHYYGGDDSPYGNEGAGAGIVGGSPVAAAVSDYTGPIINALPVAVVVCAEGDEDEDQGEHEGEGDEDSDGHGGARAGRNRSLGRGRGRGRNAGAVDSRVSSSGYRGARRVVLESDVESDSDSDSDGEAGDAIGTADDDDDDDDGDDNESPLPLPNLLLVTRLADMGFPELSAAQALQQTRNSLSQAAALLLQDFPDGEFRGGGGGGGGGVLDTAENGSGGFFPEDDTSPPARHSNARPAGNSSEWLARSREHLMRADTIRATVSAEGSPPASSGGRIFSKIKGLLRRSPPAGPPPRGPPPYSSSVHPGP